MKDHRTKNTVKERIQYQLEKECVFYKTYQINQKHGHSTTNFKETILRDSLKSPSHPLNQIIQHQTKTFVPFINERDSLGNLLIHKDSIKNHYFQQLEKQKSKSQRSTKFNSLKCNSYSFQSVFLQDGINSSIPSIDFDNEARQKLQIRPKVEQRLGSILKFDDDYQLIYNARNKSMEVLPTTFHSQQDLKVLRNQLPSLHQSLGSNQHTGQSTFYEKTNSLFTSSIRVSKKPQSFEINLKKVAQTEKIEEKSEKKKKNNYFQRNYKEPSTSQALNLFKSNQIIEIFNQKLMKQSHFYIHPYKRKHANILRDQEVQLIQLFERLKDVQTLILKDKDPQTRRKTILASDGRIKRFRLSLLLLIPVTRTLNCVLKQNKY